jgi:hypothetical protein
MVTEAEALSLFDQVFIIDGGYREFNPKTQRVDVVNDLYVRSDIKHLPEIPMPLGMVDGDVRIKDVGLRTLLNGPTEVRGNLNVSNNDLQSLAHAPNYVKGDLHVENNKLVTFDAPHCHVINDLIARSNRLVNINGCPKVDGVLAVTRCPDITDLQGLRPDTQHVLISWSPDLPLLRLLLVQGELILSNVPRQSWTNMIKTIFDDPKYRGKGKSVMLNVALMLKQADFPATNVRW